MAPPVKRHLTPEHREKLRRQKRSWWASLSQAEKDEINEKKRQAYWEARRVCPSNIKNNTKQTLCWDCQRAVKECPWSANFEPVEGWDAEETLIMAEYRPLKSYHVKACPLFEPDP